MSEKQRTGMTPGKWCVDRGTTNWVIRGKGERVIAVVQCADDECDNAECKANAQAIAALPELVEALRESLREMDAFQKYWTSPNMGLQRETCKGQELARAALAKGGVE